MSRTIDYRAFGNRLRITRLTLGVTEAEAAAACCVTPRTYRRWEAGHPVSESNFGWLEFAEKYDVSLDWLWCGDGSRLGRHLTAKTNGTLAILPTILQQI
jgi:transcriptional regulator with XRE-family HTH domain